MSAPDTSRPVHRSNVWLCSGHTMTRSSALVRAARADGPQRSVAEPEDGDLLAVDGERAPLADGHLVQAAHLDHRHTFRSDCASRGIFTENTTLDAVSTRSSRSSHRHLR